MIPHGIGRYVLNYRVQQLTRLKSPTDRPAYSESRDFRTSRSGVRYSHGSTTSSRRVYYDYSRPHGRSFWQKHRDKLTFGIGTGAGALIGGLAGGRKWAGIGALAGLGGSALYTYKLRHRHHRRRY